LGYENGENKKIIIIIVAATVTGKTALFEP
jgi:hypothetical protein